MCRKVDADACPSLTRLFGLRKKLGSPTPSWRCFPKSNRRDKGRDCARMIDAVGRRRSRMNQVLEMVDGGEGEGGGGVMEIGRAHV